MEEIVVTWNCGGDTDTGGESTSEEMTTPSALFSDFPWLNELVAVDNCTNQKVSLYQTGIFQFLYIESEGTETLYNQNGQFYCTSAPNFDCLAAYNLTDLLDTWSCSSLQVPSISYKITQKNKIQEAALNIFPNPARDQFFIEKGKVITPQSIQLVDIMGREIRSIVLNDSLTTVEVTDLENGLYFLQYQIGDTIQTVKLLVEK